MSANINSITPIWLNGVSAMADQLKSVDQFSGLSFFDHFRII